LESILTTNSGREQVYAAEAVLRIGGNAAAAIMALERASADPDRQARDEATKLLKQEEFCFRTP